MSSSYCSAVNTLTVPHPTYRWADSGKLFCGVDALADTAKQDWATSPVAHVGMTAAATLDELAVAVWKMVGKGVRRSGPEREVPLMVWRTAPWGLWYTNQLAAGNRLDGAKVEWTFRVGPGAVPPPACALRVLSAAQGSFLGHVLPALRLRGSGLGLFPGTFFVCAPPL